jgi:hypothetical protein
MVKAGERTERVTVRLTPEELAKLQRLADADGLTLADALRVLLRRSPEPKKQK